MKARALGSRRSGILRLGLPPSTRDITQPLIRAFVRRCPEVEVVRFEGTVEEVGGWIDRGLVEVGVVASEQPGMDAVPLVEDEIVVITAQADERAARPGISLADLQADPFVLYLGYERVARSLHEEHGMTLNPVHRVWQMSTLLEMVKAGRRQRGVLSCPQRRAGRDRGGPAVPGQVAAAMAGSRSWPVTEPRRGEHSSIMSEPSW